MGQDTSVNVVIGAGSIHSSSDHVRVVYSGLNDGALMMGDAVITAMKRGTLTLQGDQSVRKGMYLTLLIFLPGAEEPIAIAESRTSAVDNLCFDVDLLSSDLLSMSELEHHIRSAKDQPTYARSDTLATG